jgi:hypothetical protein
LFFEGRKKLVFPLKPTRKCVDNFCDAEIGQPTPARFEWHRFDYGVTTTACDAAIHDKLPKNKLSE